MKLELSLVVSIYFHILNLQYFLKVHIPQFEFSIGNSFLSFEIAIKMSSISSVMTCLLTDKQSDVMMHMHFQFNADHHNFFS